VTDLLWPGDERAGEVFGDAAVLAALVRVEAAWLAALTGAGIAGPEAADDLAGLAGPGDVASVAAGAEAGGNPVIPLLALLRERLAARNPAAAGWLHRGLTSQDVLDTGLALSLRDAVTALRGHLAAQVSALATLADRHRRTPMTGRTLTQPAEPITFGLRAAGWLRGVLDARDRLDAAGVPPVQLGGAAGNLAAVVDLAGSPQAAADLVAATAAALGLAPADPWHTARAPFVQAGDALVACSDAFGRIAGDVLLGARPEIGELAEPRVAGRGGSSAMAHKTNPVLAVLIRRAALAAPPLGATLHAAAAAAVDERPDGAWHAEWAAIRALARRTICAAAQTAELVGGLDVRTDRMAANLRAADLAPAGAGATDRIIDAALARAEEQA
jgi:3-carboxy-cis,cis-muconate cycloisomerase